MRNNVLIMATKSVSMKKKKTRKKIYDKGLTFLIYEVIANQWDKLKHHQKNG